jgi:hypothetical protein
MNQMQLSALFEEARSQLGVKKGSNTIYRVPPLAAAIPFNIVSPPVSAPVTLRFRRPGIALALYGQVVDGLNSTAATTELRVQFGGERELVTDGTGPQFAPFLMLFGPNQIAYPLELPTTPGVDWSFFYKNTSGTTPLPVATLPSVFVAVLEF